MDASTLLPCGRSPVRRLPARSCRWVTAYLPRAPGSLHWHRSACLPAAINAAPHTFLNRTCCARSSPQHTARRGGDCRPAVWVSAGGWDAAWNACGFTPITHRYPYGCRGGTRRLRCSPPRRLLRLLPGHAPPTAWRNTAPYYACCASGTCAGAPAGLPLVRCCTVLLRARVGCLLHCRWWDLAAIVPYPHYLVEHLEHLHVWVPGLAGPLVGVRLGTRRYLLLRAAAFLPPHGWVPPPCHLRATASHRCVFAGGCRVTWCRVGIAEHCPTCGSSCPPCSWDALPISRVPPATTLACTATCCCTACHACHSVLDLPWEVRFSCAPTWANHCRARQGWATGGLGDIHLHRCHRHLSACHLASSSMEGHYAMDATTGAPLHTRWVVSVEPAYLEGWVGAWGGCLPRLPGWVGGSARHATCHRDRQVLGGTISSSLNYTSIPFCLERRGEGFWVMD